MVGGRGVMWGRRGLCLTALVVLVTAGIAAPASAAKAKVKPAPSTLSVTTTPALQPGFDPSITDYVSLCNASTPVQVSVGAPAGTTVAVDGHLGQTGTFVVAVTRDVGQGFSFVVTTGGTAKTYYVRCLPADFPPITVQRNGPTQAQYYMVTPFLTTNFAPPPPPISIRVPRDRRQQRRPGLVVQRRPPAPAQHAADRLRPAARRQPRLHLRRPGRWSHRPRRLVRAVAGRQAAALPEHGGRDRGRPRHPDAAERRLPARLVSVPHRRPRPRSVARPPPTSRTPRSRRSRRAEAWCGRGTRRPTSRPTRWTPRCGRSWPRPTRRTSTT